MNEAATPEKMAEQARTVLAGLLKQMDFDAQVEAAPQDGGGILIGISGADSELLLGEDGQRLDALQYLMNRMLRRACGPEAYCILDTCGYRQRRRETMAREALDMASRVRQTGRPYTFPPLSPSDRRAIHRALAEDPDLETLSSDHSDAEGHKHLTIRLRPPPAQ